MVHHPVPGRPYHARMRLRRLLLPAAAALLGAAALGSPTRAPSVRPAFAAPASAVLGPTVALLATRPGAEHTSLYLARAGEAAAGAPVATFAHREDGAVRGAVLGDGVLAVADTRTSRDLSFAASLFRLTPHRPVERLCDGVVHSSRPLVTAAGRVFVSRGVAGPETPGAYRVDELTIDEVDPATSAVRTVHAYRGLLAFLAGAHGHEILVYRVDTQGADLVALDPDTGALRVVTRLLPFARDFSVDVARGALVMQERDDLDKHTFTVDRVDLATGARDRLHKSPSPALAPFAWPGGDVAFSADGKRGLGLLAGRGPLHAAPLGDGVDIVQALSADGAWAAAVHTVPGHLPVPFAVEVKSGKAAAISAPAGARVSVAGFLGGAP